MKYSWSFSPCHLFTVFGYNTITWYTRNSCNNFLSSQPVPACYVIKELIHALAMRIPTQSLESNQEARVARGAAESNSYASLVLSKIPTCIDNLTSARLEWINFFFRMYLYEIMIPKSEITALVYDKNWRLLGPVYMEVGDPG